MSETFSLDIKYFLVRKICERFFFKNQLYKFIYMHVLASNRLNSFGGRLSKVKGNTQLALPEILDLKRCTRLRVCVNVHPLFVCWLFAYEHYFLFFHCRSLSSKLLKNKKEKGFEVYEQERRKGEESLWVCLNRKLAKKGGWKIGIWNLSGGADLFPKMKY